jgi:predicted CoA-substrate-specific enzyme activase
MGERYRAGFDLGSVSLDAAVLDGSGKLVWSRYQRVNGRPRQALAALCRELCSDFLAPNGLAALDGALASGSGKALVAELLGVGVVNEIVAHGTAAARFAGGKASVFEIGGQDSKFILIDEHGPYDYAMNELCAAGTGAFLDVQAERLGLSIEELSRLADQALRVPGVAGRCSVFAKSDLIHLQQRGTPLDEIVAGLCFALARNFLATLVRGREIVKPVIFQGGVALNDGVARAFREMLGLAEAQLLRPKHPGLMGALGAAWLCEAQTPALTAEKVESAGRAEEGQARSVALSGWTLEQAAERQRAGLEEYSARDEPPAGALALGLDVGSVSTDAVLLDEAGGIAARVYTFTAGKPLEATRRALAYFGQRFEASQICAVGVTGSGRRLVARIVGADAVIDEITSQARGAHAAFPDVETVVEIGGQDAKFIQLDERGLVKDFEMNRACSAGTGSFLQEQAARLGVDLKTEFAALAQQARAPTPLASRCTVFMESDLVHHLQQGAQLPALTRGIAEAVVDNYMDRVARQGRPGRRVVLQGGVAHNAAVVDAFRQRLANSTVEVHPTPGLSGAVGVALMARELAAPGPVRAFRGFALAAELKPRTFGCQLCENRCEVNIFEVGADRFYFGDLCGRYSEAATGEAPGKDHTEVREMMLRALVRSAVGGEVIGLPEALSFREYFPFWFSFFGALGFKVVTSGPTTAAKLHAGLARLPAETCLPTKLLFGHVAELEQAGVKRVFIPATDRMAGGLCCPYVQHAAAMVAGVFPSLEVLSVPLLPEASLRERERLIAETARRLSRKESEVEQAIAEAFESFRLFKRTTAVEPRTDRPTVVLLGKPYHVTDRFLNLALPAKLARAGFDVVLADQLLPSDEGPVPAHCECVTWGFSRRMLRAAAVVAQRDHLFAVTVGNFGCGPDSFVVPLVEAELGDKPSLFLEMDEHRADAGLDTRVEAFAQRALRWLRDRRAAGAGKRVDAAPKTPAPRPGEGKEFLLPWFSDHAHAFAGALRAEGMKARVLPLTGPEALQAAVEVTGGKQCLPFQAIAGDALLSARRGELPRGATYLFPVTGGNCLITQYVPTIRRHLEELGRADVAVMGTRSEDILERFGPGFILNLGRGVAAIEYLLRTRYELRPYEVNKGEVDAAYRRSVDLVVESLAASRPHEGLATAVAELRKVETRDRGTRPVIGVAGDVYTRVNPVANGGLFELLEELGCEVWLSPTILDMVMSSKDPIPGRLPRYRELWESTAAWATSLVKSMELWQVQRQFKGLLRNIEEPGQEQIDKSVEGLLASNADLVLVLNVAKHVDFAKKRVDGILNAFCLNCMVGTSTAAVYPGLKEKTGEVPMMSLVFDGLGATHLKNRLEAFVHRVNRARASRRAGAEVRSEC